MKKAGRVFNNNILAGIIAEDDSGFSFTYDEKYLLDPQAKCLSVSLPLRKEAYRSVYLFPYFDGLIPEEWLLRIPEGDWKIIPRDRMEMLLTFCARRADNIRVERIAEAYE